MRATIRRAFADGTLTPQSTLDELKHIGPYLYRRMTREFAPTRRRLTIRTFASRISPMSLDVLKSRVQRSLQNERKNQCVPSTQGKTYHVADFNTKGYEAILTLIRVLARNEDGYNLGRRFQFDGSRLRMPPQRTDNTKFIACHRTRSRCRRNSGVWADGQCHPRGRARGFPGVSPYSGQRYDRRRIMHGQYSRKSKTERWRRPGRLNKV